MYLTSLLFRKPHWCVSANHFVSKATVETVAIKIEFVTLLGHWTQGRGKILEGFPKASFRVLTICWPGSRHPDRAAHSTIFNTPLSRPGHRPSSQLRSELGFPAAGKTSAFPALQRPYRCEISRRRSCTESTKTERPWVFGTRNLSRCRIRTPCSPGQQI